MMMVKFLNILTFTLYITSGSHGQRCMDVASEAYTYHICKNSTANGWEQAREQCQNWNSQADLMTFPTEDEFNFIFGHLENAQQQTNVLHYAFIGVYQAPDISENANPFQPQTGNLYWVTDPETPISNDNGDFYFPFARFIEEFETLEPVEQQKENIIISSTGDTFGGQTFNSATLDAKYTPLLLICSMPGVGTVSTEGTPEEIDGGDNEETLPLWLFITIIAGAVLGLLLLIIVIALVCKKCHEKSSSHKFIKVPPKDSSLTPTNSTYAQQNNHSDV